MSQERTCCFTGHRPDKLPWGSQEEDSRCCLLKERLNAALERAYGSGYIHFISGMARGADFYFSEAVLVLRENHPEVSLECARPCESQANAWPQQEKRRYQEILDRCDYETLVQHHYDRGCMMRRNRYMVDRSSRIIAVYDGVPKGGTAQTLAYAMRQGLETDILSVE
ncbi:MAG: SLOG family protein [Lawsonibacter sp.]